MRAYLLAALIYLIWPTASPAEWLEASSQNFVIYADDSETDIGNLSEKLERYHSAIALITDKNISPPSPSCRLYVYVVRNTHDVRTIYGDKDSNVAGFYVPRAGYSIAIVPRGQPGKTQLDFATIALLHEYTHHFVISAQDYALPQWLNEGAAEFFSSAQFLEDGSVRLGLPAMHRAYGLFFARDISVETLFDPAAYERIKKSSRDAYYGKSWLLYHYLVLGGKRDGQLIAYINAMQSGKTSSEAAAQVFGPFSQLEKELRKYLRQLRISSLRIPAEKLQTGPISIRKLTAGEAAIMPVRIRYRSGVTREQAAELLPTARLIASKFPSDAAVLASLAEAEYDAGNDEAAVHAADAAISVDPHQPDAYVQKGFALFRMAKNTNDKFNAYKTAMEPLLILNGFENDHPIPLIYYHKAELELGRKPSKLAVDGLTRAVELAPFDLSLKLVLAAQLINDNRFDLAKRYLRPVAFDPHGKEKADMARTIIDQIDKKQFSEVKSSLDAMTFDSSIFECLE